MDILRDERRITHCVNVVVADRCSQSISGFANTEYLIRANGPKLANNKMRIPSLPPFFRYKQFRDIVNG